MKKWRRILWTVIGILVRGRGGHGHPRVTGLSARHGPVRRTPQRAHDPVLDANPGRPGPRGPEGGRPCPRGDRARGRAGRSTSGHAHARGPRREVRIEASLALSKMDAGVQGGRPRTDPGGRGPGAVRPDERRPGPVPARARRPPGRPGPDRRACRTRTTTPTWTRSTSPSRRSMALALGRASAGTARRASRP